MSATTLPRQILRAAHAETWRSGPFLARVAPHTWAALTVMVALIWLNSGTLAPYSATPYTRALMDCGYTGNTDHGEFLKTWWMLKGYPIRDWGDGIMLRRWLHPFLIQPFAALFGFMIGGVIANMVIHGAILYAWSWFLFATSGRRAAVAGVWLLAAWPGIMYWAGLPYPYAAIVPVSVLGFMSLWWLATPRSVWRVALACLGLGLLSQAYDVLPFFGPAALGLILWANRRVVPLVVGAVCLGLPSALWVWSLLHWWGAPGLENSNTVIYANILGAYARIVTGDVDFPRWAAMVAQAPGLLVENFFDATFAALPIAFTVMVVPALVFRLIRPHPAEMALALAMLLVFAFNNLAPPYEGWQMRGDWIARLYQPVFIVMVSMMARVVAASLQRGAIVKALVGLPVLATVGANIALSTGGVTGFQPTAVVHHRFYRHAEPDIYWRHLEAFGRRPLGFCVRGRDWPTPFKSPE